MSNAGYARDAGPPWHAETVEAALERCGSSAQGLAPPKPRAARGGRAEPPAGRQDALARGAALRSGQQPPDLCPARFGARHHPARVTRVDAVVILAVVVINATIGFIQEGRAEKSLEAIRAMLTREVLGPARRTAPDRSGRKPRGRRRRADRSGRPHSRRPEAPARHEPQDRGSGADRRSRPHPTRRSTPSRPTLALGDRASMAYSGTLVASGQGAGLVVATGAATELGRISAMVGGVETLTTPLLRQMNVFARRLTIVILAARGLRLRLRLRWCAATRSSMRSWPRSASRSPPFPKACPR